MKTKKTFREEEIKYLKQVSVTPLSKCKKIHLLKKIFFRSVDEWKKRKKSERKKQFLRKNVQSQLAKSEELIKKTKIINLSRRERPRGEWCRKILNFPALDPE